MSTQRKHTTAESAEQYFSAEPSSKDVRRTLHVTLRGYDADVQVSNGVFSASRVDLGTSVLLRQAPELPEEGTVLDLGCGWGPVTLAMAFESPQAQVWAVDVNERTLELTCANAKANGCDNVHVSQVDDQSVPLPAEAQPTFSTGNTGHAASNTNTATTLTAESLPADLTFDAIWSNPPIRVGKETLHTLLMAWLPRLKVGGAAYLVVQKNLGSDSLIPWLDEALGDSFAVSKYASSKGFRIIEVLHNN
ncbi:class I SAM-dependent methyltransferase [Bifidobacterium oedipodis]|uniref:MFS transporter n=1 Tax=Bifidobacterium oedipodis TaxID=2675322 RepID=A0A7Y0EME5_9BIFI|nr:methyltransferase [Bifidobacterium sp. DSM 109957]NMM92934.1 MFS transporter [Bifidobacterium sp. DSM 109957]